MELLTKSLFAGRKSLKKVNPDPITLRVSWLDKSKVKPIFVALFVEKAAIKFGNSLPVPRYISVMNVWGCAMKLWPSNGRRPKKKFLLNFASLLKLMVTSINISLVNIVPKRSYPLRFTITTNELLKMMPGMWNFKREIFSWLGRRERGKPFLHKPWPTI